MPDNRDFAAFERQFQSVLCDARHFRFQHIAFRRFEDIHSGRNIFLMPGLMVRLCALCVHRVFVFNSCFHNFSNEFFKVWFFLIDLFWMRNRLLNLLG